jgi:hypothetical protein
MLKKISDLGTPISKNDQKTITGGFPFPPLSDCCVCVYRPAGSPFPVLITQSCLIPCPVDGDFPTSGDGC